ncbi:hypothetical protein SFR_1409 [Streptomyces sp. FR-008]|nr:hypothetical protein SFR_1409 [Streptomyces sp. FR-008]
MPGVGPGDFPGTRHPPFLPAAAGGRRRNGGIRSGCSGARPPGAGAAVDGEEGAGP